jgi:hypothetical protein
MYDVTFECEQDQVNAVADAALYYIPNILLSQYLAEAAQSDCHLCQLGAAWVDASFPGMLVACEESEHVTASEKPGLVELAAGANAELRALRERFGDELLLDAVMHFVSTIMPPEVLAAVEGGADGLRSIYGEYDPMDYWS